MEKAIVSQRPLRLNARASQPASFISRAAPARRIAVHHRRSSRLFVSCQHLPQSHSTSSCGKKYCGFPTLPTSLTSNLQKMLSATAAALVASTVCLSPAPCLADMIQTVPASSVTDYAKPLKKQPVDKGKIWIVFVGGAATLFAITVVAENNNEFFPAIARANQAMAESQKRAKENEERLKEQSAKMNADWARNQAAVEAGLAEARARAKQQAAALPQPSAQTPAVTATPKPSASTSPTQATTTPAPAATAVATFPAQLTAVDGATHGAESSAVATGSNGASSSGYQVVVEEAGGVSAPAWAADSPAATSSSSSSGVSADVAAVQARVQGVVDDMERNRQLLREFKIQQTQQQQQRQEQQEQQQ